ncbi:barstar family protein [Sphingomonas sp. UV9]|uniref:barstar family protein n=1 Tax=Sphingomonas sp. UV9 TaxID=1851410 RepID=UPI001F0BE0DC|nr:barstar family protein [Sphingomonas sp. UV9]
MLVSASAMRDTTPTMTTILTIAGKTIHDIPSFYAEINRVFMAEEDWKLGESLDALDDMMRGGYGAIRGNESVRLVWQDIDLARSSLGLSATCAFLQAKLERPGQYDVERIDRQLSALKAGTGQTYFEIILEIIADHPNIHLVAA